MPVVADSSPLIALAAINRLALLPALFDSVVIPPAVAFETRRAMQVQPAWLRVQRLRGDLPPIVQRPTLGVGEREAIALALELGIERMVVDDLSARRVAQASGLNVVGTLGLLLAAKRLGLVERVRPELDNLVKASFFVHPLLYDEMLRVAEEADT